MKIIEQSHELLKCDAPLKRIEAAGRTCYQSEKKITDSSAEKFVDMLIRHNHHAMIEFGDIIVRFITNRGVTHELVRHRHCSFAQESTRYVRYDGEMTFIRPVWSDQRLTGTWNVDHSDMPQGLDQGDRIWMETMARAEHEYKALLTSGWKAQAAREILPGSLKTEIVVKANIREWRHIFQLRCAKAAHPQMRALMLGLLRELKTTIPILFDDLDV